MPVLTRSQARNNDVIIDLTGENEVIILNKPEVVEVIDLTMEDDEANEEQLEEREQVQEPQQTQEDPITFELFKLLIELENDLYVGVETLGPIYLQVQPSQLKLPVTPMRQEEVMDYLEIWNSESVYYDDAYYDDGYYDYDPFILSDISNIL